MRHALIILTVSILIGAQDVAGDTLQSGESYFVDGITSFDEGNYADAVNKLKVAYDKLPSLADYSLLYITKSHFHMGDTSSAMASLKELYDKYPDSPLVEEARGIEVMTAIQGKEQDALEILRKYVEDYPSDMEMKFVLAGLLKETGNIAEAVKFFREIYVAVCPLSSDARAELEAQDINTKDLLERGTNLIKNRRYEEAEKTLRAALQRGDRHLKRDILEKLAIALFSQRKYSEASVLFIEVGDLYNTARSFIRSGRQEEFESAMSELASTRDPKGSRLMIAYSGELRRKGKKEEALQLLREVRKIYPESEEEALWSTGWIYYLDGNPKKAQKTFGKLFSEYKTEKYLYWQARALEKAGKDSDQLYEQLDGDSYYGLLAGLKNGMLNTPEDGALLPEPVRIERVDTLAAAGLRNHAVKELLIIAESKNDIQSLRVIAAKLMGLEEYRRAILMTSTLPEEMRSPEILYPLAFWPIVTSVASIYDIDPFLLLSLIREESHFDPEALSSAGAMGLMQLMPQTAKTMARSLNLSVARSNSLHDAELNIKIGTHYLSTLLKQFNSVPAALAAYNAGGTRVKEWLSETDYEAYDEFIEDIPFEETRNYVKRIVSSYYHYILFHTPERDTSFRLL